MTEYAAEFAFDKLETWVRINRDRLLDEAGVITEDDDEITADDLLEYLRAATPAVTQFMKEHGLWIDNDAKILHFDVGQFPAIRELAHKIIKEYEEDTNEVWTQYGLSGDDDCDYNGGYLIIAMDALELDDV